MKNLSLLFIFLLSFSNVISQSSKMEKIANKFLESLTASQKQKAIVAFEDENRTKWHFFPSTMYEREGVPLKELDERQKDLVQKLFGPI